MNARALAAQILVATERGDGWATDLLSRALGQHPGADPRDRALATELVYGVLRQQLRLDHALRPRVHQELERLEPLARALLRLGAYQLLFLDRTPAPIAVSATQDAAGELGAGRLRGLLNAALRRLGREGESLPDGDDDEALGVRWSLPAWVVGALRRRFGDAGAAREAEALRRRAPLTVRPTLSRGGARAVVEALEAEGFQATPAAHGTLLVTGPGDPFGTRAFAEGLFMPQDPASLAVVDLLGPPEAVAGKRVLDLCAGRGVKTTALADRGAHVTAVDVVARKLKQAARLAERLGVGERVETRPGDPTADDPTADDPAAGDPAAGDPLGLGTFDHVLVDAPCTGLGTLRRRPEVAWRTAPSDVGRLAALQAQLLAAAAPRVAPGGLLVYAVCTFTPEEADPALPEGFVGAFEPVGEPHVWRPSDGVDGFAAHVWRRRG